MIINKSLKGLKKLYYAHYGCPYQNAYYGNVPFTYGGNQNYGNYSIGLSHANPLNHYCPVNDTRRELLKDYGPNPLVININEATKQNIAFRSALWTGKYFQITLMTLQPGEDIGLEIHPNVDQFIRIEQGQGFTQMGQSKENLNFTGMVHDDSAIIIPAGIWHNLTNVGNIPLKLYSIYAPPNHPFGIVHPTKMDAATEQYYSH